MTEAMDLLLPSTKYPKCPVHEAVDLFWVPKGRIVQNLKNSSYSW